MKKIDVSSSIIFLNNKIFVTQRGYGEFKDMWEFPGGKIEPGETGEQAIIREIKEELETEIEVCDFLNTIEYEYPSFELKMHNYICKVKNGKLELLEHEDAKWISIDEIDSIDFLPADKLVIPALKDYMAANK